MGSRFVSAEEMRERLARVEGQRFANAGDYVRALGLGKPVEDGDAGAEAESEIHVFPKRAIEAGGGDPQGDGPGEPKAA